MGLADNSFSPDKGDAIVDTCGTLHRLSPRKCVMSLSTTTPGKSTALMSIAAETATSAKRWVVAAAVHTLLCSSGGWKE